jgi:hypothetical protein
MEQRPGSKGIAAGMAGKHKTCKDVKRKYLAAMGVAGKLEVKEALGVLFDNGTMLEQNSKHPPIAGSENVTV